jgi:hypothetical protein
MWMWEWDWKWDICVPMRGGLGGHRVMVAARELLPRSPRMTTNDTKEAEAEVRTPSAAQRRPRMWEVLQHCDHALLFWGKLISAIGTQMQVVAVAWQVLLLTQSPVTLGLIGLAQGIPRLLFSLAGGVVADVVDGCRLLLVVNSLFACTSATLAVCTMLHVINVAIIDGVVLVASSVAAFEFPSRQAVIPSLVARERMADALAPPPAGSYWRGWASRAPTGWMCLVRRGVRRLAADGGATDPGRAARPSGRRCAA